MSAVWSCNEWDQLEEVIVGNPLRARFPTPDRSTQVAEFPDRSLENIPRGPFPQDIIEETEEDLSAFAEVMEKQGIDVIPLKMRHAKMLGGGFHCVTLDIRRTGTLDRYFDYPSSSH
jgi:hypothetical protein